MTVSPVEDHFAIIERLLDGASVSNLLRARYGGLVIVVYKVVWLVRRTTRQRDRKQMTSF